MDAEASRAESLFPAIPNAWHFPDTTTAQLRYAFDRAGEGATLTVLPYVKDGLLYSLLRVFDKDGTLVGEYNDARPCPPFTGCGGG